MKRDIKMTFVTLMVCIMNVSGRERLGPNGRSYLNDSERSLSIKVTSGRSSMTVNQEPLPREMYLYSANRNGSRLEITTATTIQEVVNAIAERVGLKLEEVVLICSAGKIEPQDYNGCIIGFRSIKPGHSLYLRKKVEEQAETEPVTFD